MTRVSARLIDRECNVVATAQVHDEGDRYRGEIDLSLLPSAHRQVFEEFEEIVDGQMLSFLDEIEERVRAFALSVEFEDGRKLSIENLQVYPRAGKVSFRAVVPMARNATIAESTRSMAPELPCR